MKYPYLIEETLTEKYPNIKKDDYIWQQMINGQVYSVGWHDLVIELVGKIEELYKKYNVDIHDFRIEDITEKYGTLRFNAKYSIGEVYELIIEYQVKSETICEECGAIGKVRNNRNWIQTLCDECDKDEK